MRAATTAMTPTKPMTIDHRRRHRKAATSPGSKPDRTGRSARVKPERERTREGRELPGTFQGGEGVDGMDLRSGFQ